LEKQHEKESEIQKLHQRYEQGMKAMREGYPNKAEIEKRGLKAQGIEWEI
jgi:hypothetical protein